MQSKTVIGQLFSLGFIVYLIWILIAGTPHERLERTCKPVRWTENISVSIVALVAAKQQAATHKTFDRIDYSCQYMLWRLFYEREYKEAVIEDRERPNEFLPAEIDENESSETEPQQD